MEITMGTMIYNDTIYLNNNKITMETKENGTLATKFPIKDKHIFINNNFIIIIININGTKNNKLK